MKTNIAYQVVIGICLTAVTVFADQTIIVPGQFALAEAGSSDNAPLGAAEQHFQQVFSSALLTNLSVGYWIDGIAFRVQGNETALPAQTIPIYNISLSQSPNAPGSLSATFANNRGADFLTVRSGALTVNAGDFPGGGSPNTFGWILFSTPYQYRGGDLLIEVAYQGFSAGRDADAAYPFTANLAQTAFGNGYNSTTADAGLYAEALVMGFSIASVWVHAPEPSTFFMVGIGFFLLLFRPSRKNLW
ncbi:MAG: PEP-CTERM sorting domain-containing protein [Verrucomicrobiota bacterium]